MIVEKTYLLPVHAQQELGLIMLKMPVPVATFYGKRFWLPSLRTACNASKRVKLMCAWKRLRR
ncbi:hypothetical protein PCI56_13645 [Plesiomonas shigelloides subsp. oncorhynchi]|nr:hypothetical protein [Plesiomonas shigelloides]MDA1380613.1 hypothetical protein [Plesiomonas shigelloides]